MPAESGFFKDLSARKAIVRTGYCEPEQGDMHNSIVVNIDESCVGCAILICHMFTAIQDEQGEVIARQFKSHPPEY